MAALIAIVVVVFFLLLVRARRNSRRKQSSNALTDALGLVTPYKGHRWRVGDRWL